MSKNGIIGNHITRAEEIIESGEMSLAKEFVRKMIAVYKSEIPNIEYELDYTNPHINESNCNYIRDVEIIKSHLENYRQNLKHGIKNTHKSNQTINVNNNNSNINTNNIEIEMTIEEIRESIDENTFIGDKEKEELLQKLNEIEKLKKSNESRTKKWNIAKGILSFIIDKGADIAIMYIPHIINAIK